MLRDGGARKDGRSRGGTVEPRKQLVAGAIRRPVANDEVIEDRDASLVAAEDERLRRFPEKVRLTRGQGLCGANGPDAATLILSSRKPPELAVVLDRHLEAVSRQPSVERADEAAGVARRNAIVVVVEVGQFQGIASRTTAT